MARDHYQEELAPDVLKLIMTTGAAWPLSLRGCLQGTDGTGSLSELHVIRMALVTQGLSARHGCHGGVEAVRVSYLTEKPCSSSASRGVSFFWRVAPAGRRGVRGSRV